MTTVHASNRPKCLIHLLHRASQLAEALFDRAAGGRVITARQLVVLNAIDDLENPSQTDICDASGIDRSTLAEIVKRLTTRRLISRKRSRTDARRYVLKLTPEGTALLTRFSPLLEQVNGEIAAILTTRQRNDLLATLTRLVEETERSMNGTT